MRRSVLNELVVELGIAGLDGEFRLVNLGAIPHVIQPENIFMMSGVQLNKLNSGCHQNSFYSLGMLKSFINK